jgi:hypothetical protein
LISLVLVGFGPVLPASAVTTVLLVDTTADVPSASACQDGTPHDCSLRGALVNANADGNAEVEEIHVPAGTYTLSAPGSGDTGGSLDAFSSVKIVGAGSGDVVIDADGIGHALILTGGTIEVSGLTIEHGNGCVGDYGPDAGGNGAGGGIFIQAIATLTDVVVANNTSCNSGGGIFLNQYGSTLELVDSVVRNNTAGDGGGIGVAGFLTLENSTVESNTAVGGGGGGISITGNAILQRSTISGNDAKTGGGGISLGTDAGGGTLQVINSTISSNVAHWHNSGTPQYFAGYGGGIAAGSSQVTIRNSTITANITETNPSSGAVGQAGGLGSYNSQLLNVDNSIVSGNVSSTDCELFGRSAAGNANILGDGCVAVGTGNTAGDPKLGELTDNGGPTLTHALLPDSPALDTGDDSRCELTDQRGISRPIGAHCDIGSYEGLPRIELSVDESIAVSDASAVLPPVSLEVDETVGVSDDADAAPSADTVITSCDPDAADSLTDVSGNLVLDLDVTDCASLSFGGLTTVGGDLTVTDNASLTMIEAPVLDEVGGDLTVTDNASLTMIEAPGLDEVGGDLTVTDDASLSEVEAPELESVGGGVSIIDNVLLTDIDLGGLLDVGGSLTITRAPHASLFALTPSLSRLVSAVGGAPAGIDLHSLDTVGRDLTIDFAQSDIDLADASVNGDMNITGEGAESVATNTAGDVTDVEFLNGAATMDAELPDGAFDGEVAFSVDRLGGAALDPVDGVDPLAAYQFAFATPHLEKDAVLTFSIDLSQLPQEDADALLADINAWKATIAVKTDVEGAKFQPLPVCASGQTPADDGCVAVTVDGDIATFRGVAAHFSAWGVVTVNQAPGDPGAPTVVSGSTPNNTGVFTVNWTSSIDPDGDDVSYALEHRDADDIAFSIVATGISTNSFAFTEGAPEPEGTWTYRVKASDGSLDTAWATDTDPIVVVDRTSPTAPSASADRAPEYVGASGSWYADTVTVSFTSGGDPVNGRDGSAGSGVASVTAARSFSTSGSHTASGTATDHAGNASPATTYQVAVDATAPAISFSSCPPSLVLGATVSRTWAASDGQSGLATAAAGSASLATDSVGSHSVSVTATDHVGHEATATCSYVVAYNFLGFASPLPKIAAKAGSTLPVKFALGDDSGRRIPDAEAQAIVSACDARLTFTGGTPSPNCLGFDTGKHQFQLDLKTSARLRAGTYTITATIRRGATTLNTVSIDVSIKK